MSVLPQTLKIDEFLMILTLVILDMMGSLGFGDDGRLGFGHNDRFRFRACRPWHPSIAHVQSEESLRRERLCIASTGSATTRHSAMTRRSAMTRHTKWPECPNGQRVMPKHQMSMKPSTNYRTSILDIDSSRKFYVDFEYDSYFA